MGKRWKALVAVLVVAVLAVVGLGVVPAIAQEEEPPPTTERGELYESFLTKVADNLGVTVDELKAAITTAQLEMLDEMVAEGVISQERADQIKQWIEEEGGWWGFGMHGFRGSHGWGENGGCAGHAEGNHAEGNGACGRHGAGGEESASGL